MADATVPTMGQQESKPSLLPHIHLLCLQPEFLDAFRGAVKQYYPDLEEHVNISFHTGRLEKLDAKLKIDAIVSPANSYARLDGAFDDAISRMLSPKEDYNWVTRKAQAVIYKAWKGYAPPGTCTVIPLDEDDQMTDETASGSVDKVKRDLKWGCKYILLCPTMRTPADVQWDREVIYNCVWSLLRSVELHNESAGEDRKIKTILITPLATGVGRVSYPRWAGQFVLAMKHWITAANNPEEWSKQEWETIFDNHEEVQKTYIDEI